VDGVLTVQFIPIPATSGLTEGGFERWQVPSACLQHRRLTCIQQRAPLLAMMQQSLSVLLGVVAYRLDPRGDPVFQIHLQGGVAQIKQRFACNKWMIWIYKILWLGTDKLINYIQQQWDGVNFITLLTLVRQRALQNSTFAVLCIIEFVVTFYHGFTLIF